VRRTPTEADTLEIGRIARAHGLRGELRVDLHWPGSDALLEVDEVELRLEGRPAARCVVEHARRSNRAILLKLAGVSDRNAADELRGARVYVDRELLPELGSGEYYLSDLVGARVVAPDGDVGEVVEVRVHPSVDCLVIRSAAGVLLEQPLVAPWVERVDTAAGLVHLSSRDGLVG
jgi:16S rRNA processing protein RimM